MESGIKERLDDFIRRKGLRRTGQRDLIIKSAFSKDEHFTAEELFDRVRKSSNDISRATVYRTLGLLVEADLLREIDLGDNQTTYDPNFLDKPAHIDQQFPVGPVLVRWFALQGYFHIIPHVTYSDSATAIM